MTQYVDFEKLSNGDLKISFISPDTKAEFEQELSDHSQGKYAWNWDSQFGELVNYQTCNGWWWLNQQQMRQIGA